jgi:hypothetical protein
VINELAVGRQTTRWRSASLVEIKRPIFCIDTAIQRPALYLLEADIAPIDFIRKSWF